jgi:peptidoglycan/xylan/chitin deacetylase (PgdA/CDA1 family)
MYAERTALAVFGHRSRRAGPRILCYHSVGTAEWGVNDISPRRFEEQLELALETGFRFVSAERIARGEGQPGELAITFDDGLTSVVSNGAPVLGRLGIPWTLFVVSEWAEGRHAFGEGLLLDWDGVQQAASAGATIGSHSRTHPNFGRLPLNVAADELGESRRTIELRTGLNPTTFAIPFGQSMNWSTDAARLAREVGYEFVYAQSEERHPCNTVPRTFVTRFDDRRIFGAALRGSFDRWEEWV